ncbi:MAG TPA: ATP-binding cassette domain-containing protein, partial [bacterium]
RLSARQNLRFFARLYDVPGPRIDPRIDELLERVDMLEPADRQFSGYSSGMKQRIAIARALLHNPPILLMDEPTSSLDPKTSRSIMRLIAELSREHQLPAIINIHDVSLAQAFADRIVGLADGRIVFDGDPQKVNDATLSAIYGEEDWSKTIHRVEDEDENGDVPVVATASRSAEGR